MQVFDLLQTCSPTVSQWPNNDVKK